MVQVARLVDELVVISPQPWFPLVHRVVEQYRHRPLVPAEDVIDGVRVLYPRFLSVPRYLKPLDPLSIAASLVLTLARHPELRRPDVLDIHCAYPDGLAGALVARFLGVPSVVTLRGHDVNDVPQAYPLRRLEVKAALALVDRVFSVAQALVEAALELGTTQDKCAVLSNGVDRTAFYPLDRVSCRQRLGLPAKGRMILCVGYLIRRKGQHLVAEALGQLRQESDGDDIFAAFVGSEGDEPGVMAEIEQLVQKYDLGDHLLLPGRVPHEELLQWYNAADVMCLASEKEGWANVLLESLACGTPVVGTRVWGTPEVISRPELGILVERTVPAIRQGLADALGRSWDREVIVDYAQQHTWEATARRVVQEFQGVVDSTTHNR
jgi:glycosyltransferase involved in cell wall biosynthesis